MNKLSWLLLMLSFNALAYTKIPLMSGKVYAPQGYDTNDSVEVVVSGRLPDMCHRNPSFEVNKTGNHFKITLFAYYVPDIQGCKQISVPYSEVVNLGMLDKGDYQVSLQGVSNTDKPAKLKIIEATSSLIDDFKYGNVMGIKEDEAGRGIELVGTNPVSCLKFESMETIIQNNVIVFKPHFKEEGECKEDPTPFAIRYEVPYLENSPRGVLLHVRVMNGRSYNYLYRNKL
ncbi:MAG: hypothetical protein AB7I27_02110 [Bacteriovoracaceae bacterium]